MRKRTLLIVDDEENILSSLKRLLRREGYEILTAASGAEGLSLLARGSVDVIVSDQRMPGMTGVEFLRRSRDLSPETIRIVLSGFTELTSITEAINEGAIYKFLTKPWDDAQLREQIREAFRSKELQDENRRLENALRVANRNLASVNAELEEALESQRRLVERGEAVLDVTREIVDAVPVPIIGVDDDGTLVFANREASARIGALEQALGASGIDLPPGPLQAAVHAGTGETALSIDGVRYRTVSRPMGLASKGCGRVIALLPETGA